MSTSSLANIYILKHVMHEDELEIHYGRTPIYSTKEILKSYITPNINRTKLFLRSILNGYSKGTQRNSYYISFDLLDRGILVSIQDAIQYERERKRECEKEEDLPFCVQKKDDLEVYFETILRGSGRKKAELQEDLVEESDEEKKSGEEKEDLIEESGEEKEEAKVSEFILWEPQEQQKQDKPREQGVVSGIFSWEPQQQQEKEQEKTQQPNTQQQKSEQKKASKVFSLEENKQKNPEIFSWKPQCRKNGFKSKLIDDQALMDMLKQKIELEIKEKKLKMRQEICEAHERMLHERVNMFKSITNLKDQNDLHIVNFRRQLLSEICNTSNINYLKLSDID